MFILRLMVLKRFALLALLSALPAVANTIMVTGVNSGLGLQSSVYVNENGVAPTDPLFFAGAIDIVVDGYTRQVFCVQLLVDIYLNNTYDTIIDFSDTPNLKRVGWLLEHQFPSTPLTGAAFQLAIWDIIEDNGDGFGIGAGSVSQSTNPLHPTDAGLLAAAAQYEAVSAGMSSDYGVVYHNYLGTIPMQNLMGGPVTDGGPSAIPEPAAIVLICSGLALIGLGRLRRGRRS